MNKSYRQGQILKLVRDRQLHTQDELAKALGTIGIDATQVTLSRDIRELGLLKTTQGYTRAPKVEPAGPDVPTVIGEFLLDVRAAQNLLVLKTPPGAASAVAEALDRADWREVVGTIAGDDTVLIVAPDVGTAQSLRDKLLKFLS
jgi:transcriptional regulator of arginine metabolism